MNIVHLATAAALLAGAGPAEASEAAAVDAYAVAPAQGQGQGKGQGKGQGNGEGEGQANRPDRPRGQAQRAGEGRGRGQGQAQGQRGNQGQGQGQAQGQRDNQGQGQGQRQAAPGRSGAARGAQAGSVRPAELREGMARLPAEVRQMARSGRAHERAAAGAAARAVARGLEPSGIVVRQRGDRLEIRNPRNELLIDLDERRARELGEWRLTSLRDRQARGNAPAFCRSGEGHPVWGREWCIRQGFGLGSGEVLWSRGRIDDVVFRGDRTRDRVDRGGLIDVLGDIVFGRLALHALTLGYDRPLQGVWVTEPEGPRLLRVYAGDDAVAEFVDVNRDSRPELLYVAHRP